MVMEEEGFQVSSADDDSNFKGLKQSSSLLLSNSIKGQARREKKSFNAIICQKSNESSLFSDIIITPHSFFNLQLRIELQLSYFPSLLIHDNFLHF